MSDISSYAFIAISVSICECQNKGATAQNFSDEEKKAQETIGSASLNLKLDI